MSLASVTEAEEVATIADEKNGEAADEDDEVATRLLLRKGGGWGMEDKEGMAAVFVVVGGFLPPS